MNSYNHYAYGAIGSWMYNVIGGIRMDESQPAYKHFIIKVEPGGGITSAKTRLFSVYGEICTDWKLTNGKFVLNLVVPHNSTATVFAPNAGEQNAGVTVGSGKHVFEVDIDF